MNDTTLTNHQTFSAIERSLRSPAKAFAYTLQRMLTLAVASHQLADPDQSKPCAAQQAALGGLYYYFQELVELSGMDEGDLALWAERFAQVELQDYPQDHQIEEYQAQWKKQGIFSKAVRANECLVTDRATLISPHSQTSLEARTFEPNELLGNPHRTVASWDKFLEQIQVKST